MLLCGDIDLKDINNTEMAKWRWYALGITVLGIIVYALPWLPDKIKFLLAIPLYASFVYVYYRYICLKKGSQAALSAKDDSSVDQKALTEHNPNKKSKGRGKSAAKKS
jgi:hypothetical protein